MTTVNLLLNLQSIFEAEFVKYEKTDINAEIEKQLLQADSTIGIDINNYIKPSVYIGYRPVDISQYNMPAVVIIPPAKAKESQEEKEYDITFMIYIKHNIENTSNIAVIEALSFVDMIKDIIFNNRLVGGFILNFEEIEWSVGALMNTVDFSVVEIGVSYKSLNNYK